jgi:hypothetical protein
MPRATTSYVARRTRGTRPAPYRPRSVSIIDISSSSDDSDFEVIHMSRDAEVQICRAHRLRHPYNLRSRHLPAPYCPGTAPYCPRTNDRTVVRATARRLPDLVDLARLAEIAARLPDPYRHLTLHEVVDLAHGAAWIWAKEPHKTNFTLRKHTESMQEIWAELAESRTL